MGLKQGVCMAMCDRWFQACRTNFFEFDLLSGLLVPSAEESQRSLLSGQLHVSACKLCFILAPQSLPSHDLSFGVSWHVLQVLVNNGTDMCRKAGIQVMVAVVGLS